MVFGQTAKSILQDLAGSMDAQYVDGHNDLSDRVSSMFRLPTGQVVYNQLAQNYPPDSIGWVKRAEWRGPYLVSWDLIDHDDMDSWAASHQPERVDQFADKIEAGERVNPVVLVSDPDGNYIDVDGHHRALAYHKLSRPVRAWVGIIDPADRHAMEETHLDQVHEGASLLNKAWGDAWLHEARDEHGRWTGGGGEAGPAPGGSVTFRVRAGGQVHDFDNIYDARDKHLELRNLGQKPKLGYAPGHDARHVSQLVGEIRAGTKTRQAALQELSHSAALREKLDRHLEVGYKPERSDTNSRVSRYDISEDMMRDIARSLNEGSTWSELSKQYGIPAKSLKNAYLRRSRETARGGAVARIFGDSLHDDGSDEAGQFLDHLNMVPSVLLSTVRRRGIGISVTKASGGGTNERLAKSGETPRGWSPGSTWGEVGGVYDPVLKQAFIGNTVGHGSTDIALHEFSHAIDHALLIESGSGKFLEVYSAVLGRHNKNVSPYYKLEAVGGTQKKISGATSEFFAESLAAWLAARRRPAADRRRNMMAALGIPSQKMVGTFDNYRFEPYPISKAIADLDRYYNGLLKLERLRAGSGY